MWQFSWAPGENREPVVELKPDFLFSISGFHHIKVGNKGQLTLLAVLSVISMFRVPANKRQNYHRFPLYVNFLKIVRNSPGFFISTCVASEFWKALVLDRWIHHALDNWGTVSLGNDVCCCKTRSATFSTTFWQQLFVYFRNKLGLVYHAVSNHITAYIEFDMMWHIVKQFLKASDGITRLFFMIFFNPIHIFLSFSKLSYL